MKYVEFGTTGRTVSAIALGCMSLEANKMAASKETVRRAYELGINVFDTADVYSHGASERLLGEALRDAHISRDKIFVATKAGIVFQGMEPAYDYKAYDLSPAYLKSRCEASLNRLGMEYVDLYQPHRIDYLTHPEETARALEDLKAEGKIRYAGVSNYTVDEIRALSAYIRLESLQTQYSLLHLEPLETGLASVCLEKKMAILPWSPLHRGLLTGRRTVDHDSWQRQRELGVIGQLRHFATEYGVTMAQLALAWLIQQPGAVIPLVGTANPDHIAEAVKAVDVRLARDDWYELMVIGRGRPMPWGQPPYVYIHER